MLALWINEMKCFRASHSAIDSDSEEDDPQFYLASDSSGRKQQSAPLPSHNLSLLSLTVIIGKGRLQARTDKKVSQEDDELNEGALMSLTAEHETFLCVLKRFSRFLEFTLDKN